MYTYVCVHIKYLGVRMHACMHACMYACMPACLFVCIYVTDINVYMRTCIFIKKECIDAELRITRVLCIWKFHIDCSFHRLHSRTQQGKICAGRYCKCHICLHVGARELVVGTQRPSCSHNQAGWEWQPCKEQPSTPAMCLH